MTFELNWRAALAASFASDSYEEVAPATGPTMITTLAFDSAVEAEAAGTAREIAIRKARDRALRSLGNGILRGSADQLVAQPPNRMWRASSDSRMGAPDSMPTWSRAGMAPTSELPVGAARSDGLRWSWRWLGCCPARSQRAGLRGVDAPAHDRS